MLRDSLHPEQIVQQAQLLVDRFGSWPSFHDAEVHRIEFRRVGSTIDLEVELFRPTARIDKDGFFETELRSRVLFRCTEVRNVMISDFNHQNALIDFTITEDEGMILVQLFPAYGVFGSIRCAAMEIISVTACGE